MDLTSYCEFDEIRAALGVNDIELSDTVLNLPVYAIGLVRDLNKISASLPVAFSSILAIAEELRTVPAQALVDATHLFSVYAAARQVGVSLAAMAPKDIGDGKATMSRFADAPYKDVMTRVDAMYTVARASLIESLVLYNGSGTLTANTVPRTFFVASARGTDPVTGA